MHKNQLHLALEYEPVQLDSQKIGLKCLNHKAKLLLLIKMEHKGVSGTQINE